MFVSSVAMYVAMRKATLLKIHSYYINLSNFLPPLIFYLVLSVFLHPQLSLSFYQISILVMMSILFSYLGSLFSIKSMEIAPNPGYPLTLSKSYVIMTTILAVFLFHSILTFKAVIAILLIVFFSALIAINKSTIKHKTNSLWVAYAFGSFLCWGMLSLTTKYLLTIGVPVLTRLIYAMAIVSILQIAEIKIKKVSLNRLGWKNGLFLILIGFFAATFNYFMVVGINLAPNVGFVNAINASSIAVVTLCSTLLFKDDLTFKKIVGVLGVTLGLILLVI